jgi:chemotaxis protein methyltransferase CheR
MIMRTGAERTVAVGDAVPPRGMMAGRGGLPPPAVPKGMNRIVLELQKLTPEQFALFEQFIYRQTGIRMREGKITLLSNRIRRRLRDLGLESFEEYYRLLVAKRLPGELELFIDAITTNETHFFRTGGHFEWFSGPFLDQLVARTAAGRHDRSVRVWSAACSSGEEAYSLAICLHEARQRLAGWRLSVLGTDISEAMIAKAERGRYAERSLEQVSAARLTEHFAAPDGDEWAVKPAVASLCEFRRHNLLDPLPGPGFDCIFIRNVFIYFDRGSKEAAVRNLVSALAPGGYLVVGPADGIYDLLGDLCRESTFLYRKP